MNYLQLIGLVLSGAITLLGGLWSLFSFYDRRQDNRVNFDRDITLKISELQVKVLRIEQDLSESNKRHEFNFVSLRQDLMSALAEFKTDHKNTNHIILNKLDTQNEILIRFSTSFENHITDHTPRNRAKKLTT